MEHHSHTSGSALVVRPHRTLGDFLPLLAVGGLVILLTLGTLLFREEITLATGMQMFMGYFFLVFGGFKAIRLRGFVDAYQEYDLIAMRSRFYGYLYPFIELGLGVLFLSGMYLLYANLVTFVVMVIGAAGVYLKLRKREEIPCACLGVVFKIPMTHVTLGEDLLMAGMAAGMLVFML